MTFHVFIGVLPLVRGWGGGIDKASQERQFKAHKLGSLPVLWSLWACAYSFQDNRQRVK